MQRYLHSCKVKGHTCCLPVIANLTGSDHRPQLNGLVTVLSANITVSQRRLFMHHKTSLVT